MSILSHCGAFTQEERRFFYILTHFVRLLNKHADYPKTFCAKPRSLGRAASLCLCEINSVV
jgi:hypothetical protein